MAIVKCKECFGDLSTQADACPHCGAKRPKRTSITTWFVVLVVGWLAYQCAPLLEVATDAAERSAKRLSQPESPRMSRNAFTNRVLNQTEEDLITIMGKPDSTQEGGAGGNKYWYYKGRTMDPVSGKPDFKVQVIIERGKVKDVRYY